MSDELLQRLSALANSHRLRVLACLQKDGSVHVSELARRVGISRPLLIMHLKKLEAANLVHSKMQLSADGKAMNLFRVAPFSFTVDPEMIAQNAPVAINIETETAKDKS